MESEFPQLKGCVYLDHTGTTLYSKTHIQRYQDDLFINLYGNPHSQNPSSVRSTETIEQVRTMILDHFGTDASHYDVIFTSGCTRSMQLVAESFPWASNSQSGNKIPPVQYITTKYDVTETHNTAAHDPTGSLFCYLEDNHTSAIGIREIAADRGAQLVCVNEDCLVLNTNSSKHTTSAYKPSSCEPTTVTLYHLFAYPAQSNFNGRKYPLSWIHSVQSMLPDIAGVQGKWLVLLDAAAFVSTNHLDLSIHPAHFVALSFYKIFGFPTGLGALLVRQDTGSVLRKRYFGGGTVNGSISRTRFAEHRANIHEKFEDGTVSFLDIVALKHAFQTMKHFGLTMNIISEHTFKLASFVYNKMATMHHSNGAPLCQLYNTKESFDDINRQGGVVTFNLLRSNQSIVGYSEVDQMACLYNIHLRTGCFCNPGACQKYLGLSNEQIQHNMKAGHSCGDNVDIVNGVHTGCVRVSFGYSSTWSDAHSFIKFLGECFLHNSSEATIKEDDPVIIDIREKKKSNEQETVISSHVNESPFHYASYPLNTTLRVIKCGSSINVTKSLRDSPMPSYVLKKIIVYPVKSCSGCEVDSWPVDSTGLKWDREWMIINDRGACLSQKQAPRLAIIQPSVDLLSGSLKLTVKGNSNVPICTVESLNTSDSSYSLCHTRVCADKVQGFDCGEGVAQWLTTVLHRPCRLIQKSPDSDRKGGEGVSLSLTNQAQYLLLTMESVQHFHSLIVQDNRDALHSLPSMEELALRFRPNLLVSVASHDDDILKPFLEDDWLTIDISGLSMQVVGHCTRCQMICVDQSDGSTNPRILRCLMTDRGSKVSNIWCIPASLINR